MARRVAPSGRVLAFEPIRGLAWRLRAKVLVRCPRLWRTIRVHNVALGRTPGSAEFLVAEDAAYSGLQRRVYPHAGMRMTKTTVAVETLDRVCASATRVKFIKLDLEGGEFDAMRGGVRLMETQRPVLAFEYDRFQTPGFYGFDHAELLEFFARLDYRIFDVLGVPFDDARLWDEARVWYYFASPRETPGFLI